MISFMMGHSAGRTFTGGLSIFGDREPLCSEPMKPKMFLIVDWPLGGNLQNDRLT